MALNKGGVSLINGHRTFKLNFHGHRVPYFRITSYQKQKSYVMIANQIGISGPNFTIENLYFQSKF